MRMLWVYEDIEFFGNDDRWYEEQRRSPRRRPDLDAAQTSPASKLVFPAGVASQPIGAVAAVNRKAASQASSGISMRTR